MLSKILRGAVLATFAVVATVAQADPFADQLATKTGVLVWDHASNGYKDVKVTGYTGVGGEFKGTFDPDGSGDSTATDDFFRFFCIELGEYATSAAVQYTRFQGVADATKSTRLSWLFDRYYPNKSAGTFLNASAFGNFDVPDTADPARTSAAMQLAIWEIMFETSSTLSLASGAFMADSNYGNGAGAYSDANAMLSFVSGKTGAAPGWTFYRFMRDGYFNTQDQRIPGNQNYLSATYASGDENRVPLPGTLALFGIGLAGLGLARRKS